MLELDCEIDIQKVGLNLTAACKVICLDLAWNAATGESLSTEPQPSLN